MKDKFNIYEHSTNIYATKTGMLNIAPIKISGQYKIVVSKDNQLYLDDYNNKRVLINKSQQFLPQLFNFLKIKSSISDYKKLRYGGFSNNNTLSFHIPMYVGEKILNKETLEFEEVLPKYFVLNKLNPSSNVKEITDTTNINNLMYNLKIINLQEIGLINIFKELIHNMEYPLYSNFYESKITLYGYDYTRDTKTRKEYSLLNYMANQTYLGSLNNYILNLFEENNLIFTRFINVEFEFEHLPDTNRLFENIFGYYSFEHIIEESELESYLKINSSEDFTHYGIFGIDSMNKVSKKVSQIQYYPNLPKEFLKLQYNTQSIDTINQNEIIRIKIDSIFSGNELVIKNNLDEVYLRYVISKQDIKESFQESLIQICSNIQLLSNYNIECNLSKTLKNTIILRFNDNNFTYHIEQSPNIRWFEFVDLFNTDSVSEDVIYSYGITDNDVVINSILETHIFGNDKVDNHYLIFDNKIEDTNPRILDFFVYDGKLVIRTDTDLTPYRNKNLSVQIYQKTISKLYYFTPIPYLKYNDDKVIFETTHQFETDKYIKQLETVSKTIQHKSNTEQKAVEFAITNFKDSIHIENDILPYTELTEEIKLTGKLHNQYPNVNVNNVLDMKFVSVGNTSYITPNYFNIDKLLYDNNANVIYGKENIDPIKYHWFLIKSEAPEYLTGTEQSKRYFTDKPKITSRIIDTGLYSETIFLGVKYLLPRKYNNFSFACYLDFNDFDNTNDNVTFQNLNNIYSFIVNNKEKTLYLKINKLLDFNDLIRMGDEHTPPIFDLSLLYNVKKPYNTTSNFLLSFSEGGLLLCNDTIETRFDTVFTKDWKHFHDGKYYICLKRNRLSNTDKLTDLIDRSKPDNDFFIYSFHNGIAFQAILVRLKQIYIVNDDYVWCEDIEVQFYSKDKLLLKDIDDDKNTIIYQLTNNEKLYNNNPDKYIFIDDMRDSFVFERSDEYVGNITFLNLNNKKYKIVNTNSDTLYSLKKYYFEINHQNRYNKILNEDESIITHFRFYPEDEYKLFDNTLSEIEGRKSITQSKVTLFDRNQLWYIVKNLISTQLRFKHNTEKQIQNSLNELLLARLQEYSDFTSIKVIDTDNPTYEEYIKISVIGNDENVVIWNIDNEYELTKIYRYSSVLLPYMYETKSLSDFQIFDKDILTNKKIINIYDKNYGNLLLNNVGLTNISTSFFNIENKYLDSISNIEKKIVESVTGNKYSLFDINSIGLWNEVNGNVISSLFNIKSDIIINVKDTNQKEFEIPELFLTKKYSNVIISENILTKLLLNDLVSNNEEYISSLNKNTEEYIILEGVKWLLNRYYTVSEITDMNDIVQEFNISGYKLNINNSNQTNSFKIKLSRK